MNVSVGTLAVSNLKLSIPSFNPVSGIYSTTQTVSLSTITEGSKIYYTIDNTEPTVSSTLYTEPINVSQSTTIKAIATKDGYTDSDIVSSFYGIIDTTPSVPSSTTKEITTFYFSSPAVIGSITGTNISLTVPYGTSLTSLTPMVTHNGNSINPASGSAQNFSSPITYTVTAQDGSTQSYVVSVNIGTNTATTTKAVTSFYFTIPASIGTISGTNISLTVPFGTSLTSLTPSITHNGTSINPASGISQNFSSPVTYTVTAQDGTTQSYVVSVNISAGNQVATPTFNITPGTYYADQTVSISSSESNAFIYYTTNGTDPTPASTYYSSPISIAGNGTTLTIKAIAIKSSMTNSSVASGTWTIDKTVPTVTITAITTPYISGNAGAINSKDVSWSSNRNGSFSVRVGGVDCTTGTVHSTGTATAGATNTATVNATSLSVGTNTLRICVTDSITSQTGNNTFTITRDDTAPTVTPTPGTTSSATAINVSLACSDASSGCDKIVYTYSLKSAQIITMNLLKSS
jgi:hypothetical protein